MMGDEKHGPRWAVIATSIWTRALFLACYVGAVIGGAHVGIAGIVVFGIAALITLAGLVALKRQKAD